MGSFVSGLDATVVNVALPAIQRDLGGGLAGQQWVSNAYLLVLGSLILVGGSLSDVFGSRRVFSVGVAGFGAVSLVCALAPSIGVLVAGRALQGLFGALLTPSALAIIVAAFPAGSERSKAIGSWTAWSGISFVIGPLAGGYLVDATSWRWIFALNVPFVAITLLLVAAALPKQERGSAHAPVDYLGAVLCALGLAGPVFALIRQPELGWGAPGVAVPALAGVGLLTAFLLHEARTPHPMLLLSLFRRRNFSIANIETLSMYGGLSIMLFVLVLFLQQVAGYDALHAGLATMPITVVMFFLSRRFGAMADRYGPRLFMGAGPLVAAAGLLALQRVGARFDYWTHLLPALIVFAIGLSMTVAPLTATVLADADDHNAGIASGVNNAIARVAGLLAVAALGAVVASSFGSAIDSRLAGRHLSPTARQAIASAKKQTLTRADTHGLNASEAPAVAGAVEHASVRAFHTGLGIAAALVGLGGLLGLAGIRNPSKDPHCVDCAGGQWAGAPVAAGGTEEHEVVQVA